VQGKEREKVRDTLAERLTRMKAEYLEECMKDRDAELRAAAIRASYAKMSDTDPELRAAAMRCRRTHVPLIIDRINDPDPFVVRAAHTVLRDMSKEDFGPAYGCTREEVAQAVKDWKDWWKKQN